MDPKNMKEMGHHYVPITWGFHVYNLFFDNRRQKEKMWMQ
jgi:hypothetical protein